MTLNYISLTVIFLGVFVIQSSAIAAEGVIGASCWSDVQVFRDGINMCKNAEKTFYPGILMAVAKAATVKKCQEANQLDYGDGKCYPQCEERTFCLYGDSQ